MMICDPKTLAAFSIPVGHTWIARILFATAVVGCFALCVDFAAASTTRSGLAAPPLDRMLEPAPRIESQVQDFQIAIELPRGFERVEVGIVGHDALFSYDLVVADVSLPDGRKLARLNLKLAGSISDALKGICLRLSHTDRADGFFLTDKTGEPTESYCVATETPAWEAAAVWGEGARGGVLLQARIGGGLFGN